MPLQPLVLDHLVELDTERDRAVDEVPKRWVPDLTALKALVGSDRETRVGGEILLAEAPSQTEPGKLRARVYLRHGETLQTLSPRSSISVGLTEAAVDKS